MTDQGSMCAHEGCSCRVSAEATGNGKYCSDECAAGRGCAHEDCECGGQQTVASAEETAIDRI